MSGNVPPHPSTFATVGEIAEALSKLDQNSPVVVSTHYDNGIGYSADIAISEAEIAHQEGDLYTADDNPNGPQFVMITGAIY